MYVHTSINIRESRLLSAHKQYLVIAYLHLRLYMYTGVQKNGMGKTVLDQYYTLYTNVCISIYTEIHMAQPQMCQHMNMPE